MIIMRKGRPTKYSKKYAEMAEVACREGGFTDLKLAKLFGVSKSTINLWKKEYPEFSDSTKKGKDEWDSDKIEKSLARRATGYSYNEIEKKRLPEKDADGKITGYKLKITKITKKEMAPDTGACGIWLFNRRPDRWKNKQQVEHSGEIKTPSLVVNIAKKNGD
jgi:transposase